MSHPWQEMPLAVYEEHMSQVAQLQLLNQIMKNQWQAYPQAESAVVLGVAGGNGLEYCGSLKTVYGVDINPDYLQECRRRFDPDMGPRLKLVQMDLSAEEAEWPKADLLLADLLIEYVGIKHFCQKAAQSQAAYISCVIQSASTGQGFVSESPQQAQFAKIGKLHHDVDPDILCTELAKYKFVLVLHEAFPLPDGKCFLRFDFRRTIL